MHTQLYPPSRSQKPEARIECAATTRHGHPCQGTALEHSPFCAFHDPATAATVAAGRSRGGAAPRRRTRRLPRRLDYLQVAELTGELFVDALNHANPADPRSLRAVSQLARVLLQAVGRPKGSFVPPAEDAEPEADAPHLLRVYPPLPPTVEALLAAEAAAPRAAGAGGGAAADWGGHADYCFVPGQPAPLIEEPPATWLAALDIPCAAPPELTPEEEPDPAPVTGPGPDAQPVTGPVPAPAPDRLERPGPGPEAGQPVEPWGGQRPEQGAEQGMNRQWTGPLATESFTAAAPVSHFGSMAPESAGARDSTSTAAAGPPSPCSAPLSTSGPAPPIPSADEQVGAADLRWALSLAAVPFAGRSRRPAPAWARPVSPRGAFHCHPAPGIRHPSPSRWERGRG